MAERILIYDSMWSGHCPGWLSMVAKGFRRIDLDVYVACCCHRPEISSLVADLEGDGCEVIEIPESVKCHFPDAVSLAEKIQVNRVFFPNYGSIVYDLGKYAPRMRVHSLDIGGIWLRPEIYDMRRNMFQSVSLMVFRGDKTKKERRLRRRVIRNVRGQKLIQSSAASEGHLTLFFTDEEVVNDRGIIEFVGTTHLICDPWISRGDVSKRDAREKLGLPFDKKIFLHLGTDRLEKGLGDLCRAFSGLPEDRKGKSLVFRAGRVKPEECPLLQTLLEGGYARILDVYLSQEQIDLCYRASDWVLLPYRDQKESSGILVNAAANNRPVIVSDYGLISKWTKAYKLGLCFEHKNIQDLAEKLELSLGIEEFPSSGMTQFAHDNSPESFMETLLTSWLNK